jgi:outer membrane protein assembly factor BamB
VAGDTLVVAQKDGAVRAIDRSTREELWVVPLGSPVAGPLSYADGRVLAHTQDGKLHVIR